MPCAGIAEFGFVTGKGRENVEKQRAILEPGTASYDLPAVVCQMAQLLARKPRMLAAIALANKMRKDDQAGLKARKQASP